MADGYLGVLCPVDDFKVYGYVTATRMKLLLVVEDPAERLRDVDVKQYFSALHTLLVNAVSNPFAEIGEPLVSASFEKAVLALAVQRQHQQVVR